MVNLSGYELNITPLSKGNRVEESNIRVLIENNECIRPRYGEKLAMNAEKRSCKFQMRVWGLFSSAWAVFFSVLGLAREA